MEEERCKKTSVFSRLSLKYYAEKYTKKLWKLLEDNKGIIGLDLAILKCFCETIKSLIRRKLYICPTTIDVYNKLQESIGELLEED